MERGHVLRWAANCSAGISTTRLGLIIMFTARNSGFGTRGLGQLDDPGQDGQGHGRSDGPRLCTRDQSHHRHGTHRKGRKSQDSRGMQPPAHWQALRQHGTITPTCM